MSELRTIPNIGACTEQDLILMGYTTIASLRGKSAEELYAEECRLRGCTLDRCQLYLYRAVEYFVNTGNPDPMKCKWWFWKDDFVEPSPCGAVCVECASFPLECGGCRKINLKSATKLFSVLLASKRPLITELADKLRLKYPLLPTISPCPTMRLEAIRSIIPISCRRYPKSV